MMPEENFVEVANEPRHRFRLENEFVRVYDFQLHPGEMTLYHRHDADTFYVAIEPASILDQPLGHPPASETVSWPAGIAWCQGYASKPVIHRVTNSGTEAMRVIGAEVRRPPPGKPSSALQSAFYELKYEDTRVRVYRLNLAAGEGTGTVGYDFTGLLVASLSTRLAMREGSRSWVQQVGAGDIHWHVGQLEVEVTNTGAGPFRAYLAQWL